MKFSFSQSEMLRSLQRVVGAVPTRIPMPSLSNLHLRLEGKNLDLISTDLEITIVSKMLLTEASGEGSVLVQARRFSDIMRELPDIQLEMEIQDHFKVLLRGEGIGVFNLPGGNPIDYPDIPNVDAKLKFDISAISLKRMINKTLIAVSKDDMRPILTGFLLQLRNNELRMVATDGHRLSRIIRHDIKYKGEPRDVVIPMKALSLLLRNIDDDATPVIGLGETRATFSTDDFVLTTRLIDGSYPKYESVIPENNPNRMTVDTTEFTTAVKRAAIFSNQISRQIKFSIESENVSLESEDSEMGGRAEVKMPADYTGEPLEIAYNANYLMELLKQVDTEEVVFELASSNDAALIKPTVQAEDEDFFMLLMPIRLR